MSRKNIISTCAGKLLRERRRALDWSQAELGDRVGIHARVISNIERGARPLDLDEATAIAVALGERPDWLMGEAQRAAGT